MTDDDDASGVLRSGRRFSRHNDNVSNEPPPAQHATTNVRDTNPPPPDESELSLPDVDDSQLSPSLLSVDDSAFTTIGRAHDGRGTTAPLDALAQTFTSITTPNKFDALANDDDDGSDAPPNPDDDAPTDVIDSNDAPTDAIDSIFREADATLAAATYDFELLSERLHQRLNHDLMASVKDEITSSNFDFGQSLEKSMSLFFAMVKQDVANSNLALERRIEDRIASMDECIAMNNESTATAIESISANTNKLAQETTALSERTNILAQETTALSVRMVDHQSHLENLLGFEEARRQQMDDHVKQMVDLAALIAEVKSNATVQTQRVSAQLDGLRTKVDTHNNSTKTDIVDLRGRIVPELRDQHNAIAATVQRLETRLDSTDNTTSRNITDLDNRLAAFRAEFDAYTNNTTGISTPRRANVPDAVTIDDPTGVPAVIGDPTSVPSLPRNPLFPNIDPSTFRPGTSWYVSMQKHFIYM